MGLSQKFPQIARPNQTPHEQFIDNCVSQLSIIMGDLLVEKETIKKEIKKIISFYLESSAAAAATTITTQLKTTNQLGKKLAALGSSPIAPPSTKEISMLQQAYRESLTPDEQKQFPSRVFLWLAYFWSEINYSITNTKQAIRPGDTAMGRLLQNQQHPTYAAAQSTMKEQLNNISRKRLPNN